MTAIESEYTGPKFENGTLTLSFVTALMETFRKQEKLHRKYAYKVHKVKYLNKVEYT